MEGTGTDEERIRHEYKRMRRKGFDPSGGVTTSDKIWMPLARKWKRPVREIKRIVQFRSLFEVRTKLTQENRKQLSHEKRHAKWRLHQIHTALATPGGWGDQTYKLLHPTLGWLVFQNMVDETDARDCFEWEYGFRTTEAKRFYPMKIWLDDIRDAPDNTWSVARNEDDLMDLLSSLPSGERPEVISFDHDLGEGQRDGYETIKGLARHWPQRYPDRIEVHSANPVGAENIEEYDTWYRRMIDPSA